MSCQSNVNSGGSPVCCTTGNNSYQDQNYPGYVQPAFVSGWMYVNEHGQMCGPYIQEQLYEGLTTGFLPVELPVYPVLNGTLMNPVPLNYFKQFPHHVSTGFAYLALGISDTTIPTNSSSSHMNMISYEQNRPCQHTAPLSGNCDSQPVQSVQSHVNYCSYESNYQASNSQASNNTISCQKVL